MEKVEELINGEIKNKIKIGYSNKPVVYFVGLKKLIWLIKFSLILKNNKHVEEIKIKNLILIKSNWIKFNQKKMFLYLFKKIQ